MPRCLPDRAARVLAHLARGVALLLLVPMIATLAACTNPGAASARTIRLTECRLPKLAIAAQCGELAVPEDRSRPDGRTITTTAAILPANTLNPQPDPLFILAGGPGQAATGLAPFAALLVDVRRDRDIVLVDQRGTGRSSPLDCAAWRGQDSLAAAIETDPVPNALACARELAARGVDPAQYTTAAFIADLDAMRAALGYVRINLWGGSYGSRAVLEYLRRHPQRVRSIVLDGAVPPQMALALDVWPTREAALAAVLAACAASAACDAAHPDLAATLAAIDERFAPGGREIAFLDPSTGEPRTLQLGFAHVLAALQTLLYVPELASLVPEAIARAAADDFGPLFAAVSFLGTEASAQVNTALYFSVTCADDARLAPQRAAAILADVPTRAIAEQTLAVCRIWPHGAAPADAAQPVASDVPALILSGGLDPVTPPAYGTEVAATLSHSRHVIAAGYGHIVSLHACAPRLIAAFIADPTRDALPAGCVEHFAQSTRPPLWPNGLGADP
jgi:pimeloyl-ACP methyl ester carboxylesterase